MLKKFCYFLLFSFMVHSHIYCDLYKDKMLDTLDIIKNTFDVYYAPYEWKKEYAGWVLEEKIAEAKEAVVKSESLSMKDYHRILKRFFSSTKDYHVGVSFYSTEEAYLPFRIHSAQGKYFIAWVYKPLFSGLKDPLCVGDEVMLFDGLPIDAVVQNLKLVDFGNPESATDQALSETALTMQSGNEGYEVPNGPLSLTVRHAGTKQITTYRLNWFYHPENIASPMDPLKVAEQVKLLSFVGGYYHLTKGSGYPLNKHAFFAKEMVNPWFKKYQKSCQRRIKLLSTNLADEGDDHYIGDRYSFIPVLGEKVWSTAPHHPFYAYIYRSSEGKQVGYIRIPHYMGSSSSAEHFAQVIAKFEEEADAVVIDQLNNPGGNVFYMYALASMLSPRGLEVPKHQMAITQEDVFFALDSLEDVMDIQDDEEAVQVIGSTLWGYSVDYTLAQSMLRHFQFIIDEWESGRRLTQADYLYGIQSLSIHPKVQCTKPIIVLTNCLDFSCADFLPAILQDNGRSTIVGTQTAGAGGYVLSHQFPNIFGIEEYTFTASLAKRVDDMPIENLGVIPDIFVELTADDLEFGYCDYIEKIQIIIKNIFK